MHIKIICYVIIAISFLGVGINRADATDNLHIEINVETTVETNLTEVVTIPPGKFFEINTNAAAAFLHWNWHTQSGEIAFNIHTHLNATTQYLYQKTAPADDNKLPIIKPGRYSLMWVNKTANKIILRYQISGKFIVESYHPRRKVKNDE